MQIAELSDLIYEDLNAQVVSVVRATKDLKIQIEFDNPKDERKRRFSIDCITVIEAVVTPQFFEFLRISDQHPLLLDHTDDFGYLTFSSAPESAEQIVGRLYEAHYSILSDWRSMSAYLNHLKKEGVVELLRGGRGMIARGPYSIMRSYELAVSALLHTSLIRTAQKPRKRLSILLFDSEFVIAESFRCKEEI